MIDLEAIRQRNEERKKITATTDADEDRLRIAGWRDDDFDRAYAALHDHDGDQKCSADIDALLAEIEKLDHIAGCCACEHDAVSGIRIKQCKFILAEVGPDHLPSSLTSSR